MTGCTAAIAAAALYREAEARCPPLAYGLHLRGGKCRRLGGDRVCQMCVGDLLPADVPCGGVSWPPDGVKAALAIRQRKNKTGHSAVTAWRF